MRKPRFELLESRRVLAAVSIADVIAEAGGNQPVPINIDAATGVRAAEIRLVYDTEFLDLDNSSVAAGTVWNGSGDTQVVANVDDESGSVVIFLSSANPLTNVSGSLATLNFAISAQAGESVTTLDLVEVVLNEEAIPVSPTPQAGPDATDGELTIEPEVAPGNDSISGLVFADADGDGLLDAGEAIPGVTIRLIPTANSTEQQTTTDELGRYQFNNLPAGSYRIEQVQPTAFIDQSPNTLNVQLSSGQRLADQNFVERGLRAAQHYTRLLTTSVRPLNSTVWRNAIQQIMLDADQGDIALVAASAIGNLPTNSLPATASTTTGGSLASITQSLIAEGEADGSIGTLNNSTIRRLESPSAGFHLSPFPVELPREQEDSTKREKLTAIDAALLAL